MYLCMGFAGQNTFAEYTSGYMVGTYNTCCAWAGESFFPVVLLCQFFGFWHEIGFVLYSYVLSVQYSCGVVLVFWFWWEIVFGVTYILRVQYSFAVVSVFWLWQEIVLKMRTPFYFLWAVLMKNS
jgi:hypothetical protein